MESPDPSSGHTAVLGEGANAGYLTNPHVREFVFRSGEMVYPGSAIVRIVAGTWIEERAFEMSDDLRILSSERASASLEWRGGEWVMFFDRPLGAIDDSEVLRRFGDEAFRRRDEMLASRDVDYQPPTTFLIGRRIVERIVAHNWIVTSDDPMNFAAASPEGNEISVHVPSDDRWSLDLATDDRTVKRVTSVARAERWVLETAVPPSDLELSSIMSWTIAGEPL